MSIQRSNAWLIALGLQLLLVTAATAQSIPDFAPGVGDMQWFDQPDYSDYSGPLPPNTGWFGSASALVWSINTPDKVIVGNPNIPARFVFGAGTQAVDTGGTATFGGAGVAPPPPNANGSLVFGDANGATAPQVVGYLSGTPSGNFGVPNPENLINSSQQTNTTDTGYISAETNSGARYEFGRVEENFGWSFSTFQLFSHSQDMRGSNLSLNFANGPIGFLTETRLFQGRLKTFDLDLDEDGVFGASGRDRGTLVGNNFQEPKDGIPDPEPLDYSEVPTDFDDIVVLPTTFTSFEIQHKNEMYGVELMGMYRYPAELGHGGILEFYIGPRYLNFKEEFNVYGFSGDNVAFVGNLGPTLGDTFWETQAENNLVGGQLGYRWAKRNGRLGLISEGRFLSAANFQTVEQQGVTQVSSTTASNNARGTRVINIPAATAFNNSYHTTEFSMLGELRFQLTYQLFREVYIQGGWTGMFMDNIARPSKMVVYRLPDFGIDPANNRDKLFVNGLDIGIVINR